jgi:hypothetical protein
MKPQKIRYSERWGEKRYPYLNPYNPESSILYFVPGSDDKFIFEVYKEDTKLFEKTITPDKNGFNIFKWDLKINPLDGKNKRIADSLQYITKGNYSLQFILGDKIRKVDLEVE